MPKRILPVLILGSFTLTLTIITITPPITLTNHVTKIRIAGVTSGQAPAAGAAAGAAAGGAAGAAGVAGAAGAGAPAGLVAGATEVMLWK